MRPFPAFPSSVPLRGPPDTRFVKAFNSVSNVRMVNPPYREGRPTMVICGDDARAIEPHCILWCIPGFLRNEWTHAFKVLHA
jgi:hypothetical protein